MRTVVEAALQYAKELAGEYPGDLMIRESEPVQTLQVIGQSDQELHIAAVAIYDLTEHGQRVPGSLLLAVTKIDETDYQVTGLMGPAYESDE